MFTVTSLPLAIAFCVVTMIGWGSWANTQKLAGRDHWPFCFSYVIAGGGVPGGRVIGASDQFAAYPADNPVSPQQTAASVLGLLGLDLEKLVAARVLEEADGVPGLLG